LRTISSGDCAEPSVILQLTISARGAREAGGLISRQCATIIEEEACLHYHNGSSERQG